MRTNVGPWAVLLVAAAAAAGADDRRPPADVAEHDFGDKVLVVVTRPRDGKGEAGGGPLERAKVRRLGDRYFLVGTVPDVPPFAKSKGTVIWTPLSEVIEVTEYDSVEAVRKLYADLDQGK